MTIDNRFDYNEYDDGTSSIYDRIDDEYYFGTDLSKLESLLNDYHKADMKYWKIIELIMKYDATNKHSEKEVINKIKKIIGFVND